jgi:hypothetical protein
LTQLGGVVIFSPVFILPGLAVAALGWTIGRMFMWAQMPVKREMSNAKAPVMSVVGAVNSAGLGEHHTEHFTRLPKIGAQCLSVHMVLRKGSGASFTSIWIVS